MKPSIFYFILLGMAGTGCLYSCDKNEDSPGKPPESTLYESTDYAQDRVVMTIQKAAIGKGVNIVFMGDGFVDKDMGANGQDGTYETVMKQAAEAFFSIEPTKSYREYFNVYAVKAVSKNEGFEAKSQTVFNSKWGNTSSAWDFDSNRSKCKNYALEVPHINLQETPIIIIVNTPLHAGGIAYWENSGETMAFCARSKFNPDDIAGLVLHEGVGHALGRLADEYTATSGLRVENLVQMQQTNGWYRNVSVTNDRENVPWKHFFDQPGYPMVSLYEGGYYLSKGIWRPEENSCMRNSDLHYFNSPSRELIVKRIKSLAGEPYSWEEFLANDKYEPAEAQFSKIPPVHHAPVVLP